MANIGHLFLYLIDSGVDMYLFNYGMGNYELMYICHTICYVNN